MVSLLAVVIAAVSYWGSGGIYSGLGRGDLDMERDRPVAAASAAEAQEEIRQMLQAKSDRREARGEAPIDIDAEMDSLNAGPGLGDPGLRDEVRQLVDCPQRAPPAPGQGAARRGGGDRPPAARPRGVK